MSTLSKLLGRLGLVGLGLLLAILTVELLLQLGAAVVQATGRQAPEGFRAGRDAVRVLCVGDSNTYGVSVERHETYPAQLEAMWNQRHASFPIEVLNLGYPGMNSSRLLRELPRMLRTLEPDVVIVMVGANDFWTRPVPVEPGPLETAEAFLARRSRVHRLYRLLLLRLAGPPQLEVEPAPQTGGEAIRSEGVARFGDAEFVLGYERGVAKRPGTGIVPNTRRMIALADAAGAAAIVMAYPSPQRLYASAHALQLEAVEGTSAQLVDLRPAFLTRCPRIAQVARGVRWCPKYLDGTEHPTSRGYTIIADALLKPLARLLEERGLRTQAKAGTTRASAKPRPQPPGATSTEPTSQERKRGTPR